MTDVRVSQEFALAVGAASDPDVRVSQLFALAVVPSVNLPNTPWIVQVDWEARLETGGNPWTQAYANALHMDSLGLCLRGIRLRRRAMYARGASIPQDSCVISYRDTEGHLIPGKDSSTLYPYVTLGRGARVLRYYNGSYYPWGFGWISRWEPTDETTREGHFELSGVLHHYANVRVTPTQQANGTWVAALGSLITASQLPADNWTIDDGLGFTLNGEWGGTQSTFGAMLRDLVIRGNVIVSAEPQFREQHGVDYAIRVRHPANYLDASSTPYVEWSADAGDLDAPEDTVYHGESSAA